MKILICNYVKVSNYKLLAMIVSNKIKEDYNKYYKIKEASIKYKQIN
jgi:hypothetical protein